MTQKSLCNHSFCKHFFEGNIGQSLEILINGAVHMHIFHISITRSVHHRCRGVLPSITYGSAEVPVHLAFDWLPPVAISRTDIGALVRTNSCEAESIKFAWVKSSCCGENGCTGEMYCRSVLKLWPGGTNLWWSKYSSRKQSCSSSGSPPCTYTKAFKLRK